MSTPSKSLQSIDPVWGRIQSEASELILAEPINGGNGAFIHTSP